MKNTKKTIGTFLSMTALKSLAAESGTFASGLIFLDWLSKSKQSAWQVLPLHQTQLISGSQEQFIPSPYKGYGIGLHGRYLSESDALVMPTKHKLQQFMEKNIDWLPDYALFCSLRDYFGTDDWTKWELAIRRRKANTVTSYKKQLKDKIDYYILQQWQLHHAYAKLRKKAKHAGIKLIGDMPYYLSLRSPLVWLFQDVFDLTKKGTMRRVSGIPDGSNAHFGRQVWGHPLYKWDHAHTSSRLISLWKIRMRYLAGLFDMIRFDHAKGFFNYGAMDPDHPQNDKIMRGPGVSVFKEVIHYSHSLGLTLFTEDSGDRLQDLRNALTMFHVPGIKIFRFAINEKLKIINEEYADISSYPKNTIVYTSTHDTETLIGYLHLLSKKQKGELAKHAGVKAWGSDKKFAIEIRNALITSHADTIIIPMQDWLLTTDRINVPGTEKEENDTNWQYTLPLPIEKLPTDLLF